MWRENYTIASFVLPYHQSSLQTPESSALLSPGGTPQHGRTSPIPHSCPQLRFRPQMLVLWITTALSWQVEGKLVCPRGIWEGTQRGCDQWSSKLNPSNGWPDLAEEALTQRLPRFVQPQSLLAAETTKMAGLGLGDALGKLNLRLSFLPRHIRSRGCYLNAVLNSGCQICRPRVVGSYLASVGTGCCRSGAALLAPQCSLTRLDETWKMQVSGTGRGSLRFATLLGSKDKCKAARLFPGNKYHQRLLSNLGKSNSIWRRGASWVLC